MTNPKEKPDNPLALSINDFCNRIGIARSTFYGLANEGKIKTIAIGRRRLVPAAEVERIMAEGAQ